MTSISEFLGFGAKNARTAKELREILHISGDDVRELVRAERLDGVPICSRTAADASGKAGYFMPVTDAEYMQTIKSLKSREREIRTVRKALEKAYLTRYGT